MKGFVYILTNKAYPGLVKVGKTDKNPKERAKELFTTAVPHPFKVFGYVEFENAEKAERITHEKLDKYRESANREFFKVGPQVALDEICNINEGILLKKAIIAREELVKVE